MTDRTTETANPNPEDDMSEETGIEWTAWRDSDGVLRPGYTWNPWRGCEEVPGHPGCAHCYARELVDRGRLRELHLAAARMNNPAFPEDGRLWGKGSPRIRASEEMRNRPLRWNRAAEARLLEWQGYDGALRKVRPERPRVFLGSLMDLFDDAVPVEWRLDALRVVRICERLTWIIATKRAHRFRKALGEVREAARKANMTGLDLWLEAWLDFGRIPPNVWLLASVSDQRTLATAADYLPDLPVIVRGLSVEPMLAEVNLRAVEINDGTFDLLRGTVGVEGRGTVSARWSRGRGVDWVIVGGESGPGSRAFPVIEALELVRQCREAKVPVFVKQLGRRPYVGNMNVLDFAREPETEVARNSPEAAGAFLVLNNPKGGNPDEWPDQLKGLREFPEEVGGEASGV